MMSRITAATLALWLAPALPVSQQEQETDVPVFRITAKQVVVDFVAIDEQGRFVTDLSREEIEVIEDGKRQSILTFFPPGRLPAEELVSPGAGAPDSRKPGVTGVAGRRGGRPVRTVILIDSRVMDASNFAHTVGAVRRFIEEHLAARHAIMIAEINRGLKILTPLTRDRKELLAGVDQLRPQTVYNPLAAEAVTGTQEMSQYLQELQQQVTYVRSSLKLLSMALSGGRGRKHVVYFTEGYPLDPSRDLNLRQLMGVPTDARGRSLQETNVRTNPAVMAMVHDVISTANTFGISFYTIDARGLVAVAGVGPASRSGDVSAHAVVDDPIERGRIAGGTGTPEVAPSEVVVASFTRTDVGSLENSQNSLIALAAGTNGAAFYNTNDLESVLRESTIEQENYYLLSYAPSTRRKEGRFHNIRVESRRAGIHIRARRGYLDVPDQKRRESRLLVAFSQPELFQQLSPVMQLDPVRGKLQAILGVPGNQVRFRSSGGGYQGDILFLGQIFDEKGKAVSRKLSITRGFNLNLTAQQFAGLAGQPLLFRSEVDLKPGGYRLVLVVEDRLAGALGASQQEFEIP